MNLAYDCRDVELELVDFDKVELRNFQFGTQQYFKEQEGNFKVEALMFNIYKATGLRARAYVIELGEDPLAYEEDALVVDCLDNFKGREHVKNVLSPKNCLHVGFSPEMTFEIAWNENYEVPSEDVMGDFDICGAEGARSFIHYVSGLATNVIIDFLKTGKKIDMVGSKYSVTKII